MYYQLKYQFINMLNYVHNYVYSLPIENIFSVKIDKLFLKGTGYVEKVGN